MALNSSGILHVTAIGDRFKKTEKLGSADDVCKNKSQLKIWFGSCCEPFINGALQMKLNLI
jgi:hypothetical protein